FYTSTDWLRLATKLAAAASPCAQYCISIPPLAADKTAFRYDQPWRIRALGPNFHVLAEINITGWTKWVAENPGATWYDAGVEAIVPAGDVQPARERCVEVRHRLRLDLGAVRADGGLRLGAGVRHALVRGEARARAGPLRLRVGAQAAGRPFVDRLREPDGRD